jgi:hypothetical protein
LDDELLLELLPPPLLALLLELLELLELPVLSLALPFEAEVLDVVAVSTS